MNTNYDDKLFSIDFYKIHPEYLPFVGNTYDTYKILHVGESHYIKQSPDNEKYNLDYFTKHWWNGTHNELKAEKFSDWYNTRSVVNNYLSGNRRKGHLIFTNVIKSFSKKILKKQIININYEESQKYNYFAFMNFFQMPSLYEGLKFWNSIEKSAKNKNIAIESWENITKKSSYILDSVIDILQPRLVIFTSKSAYCAYINSENAEHSNDDLIKVSPHPGCPAWNKKCKKYGGITGEEQFEIILSELIK